MKKWLYGIISLIMLGSGIAVAMPEVSNIACEDGTKVEVTVPVEGQTPSPEKDNSGASDNSSAQDDDDSNSSSESDNNSSDNSNDDNSEDPEETEEITTYEFRNWRQCLVDNDISKTTITEDDLSGNGTQSNPYIIKNLNGFLYLRTISLNKHYVELENDIVLNDETFDKDGKPSGGDGVVYDFDYGYGWYDLYFKGNGHKFTGYYSNHPDSNGRYFLYSFENLQDLTFENFYMTGNESVCVFGPCTNTKNIVIKQGYIYGRNKVSSFNYIRQSIKNCDNYATVSSIIENPNYNNQSFSGIAYASDRGATIENCNNYGYIFTGQRAAGILAYSGGTGTRIINCNNYGTIEVTYYHAAGILAHNESGANYIKNCNNYGLLVGPKNRMVGGIVGSLQRGCTIESCNNYMSISENGTGTGEIVGYIQNKVSMKEFNLTIKNCNGMSGKGSFIGGIQGSTVLPKNTLIQIENSYLFNNNTQLASDYKGLFVGEIGTNIPNLNFNIYNNKIDVDANWFLLFGGYSNKDLININISNLYIKANCTRKLTMTRLTYIDYHPDWNYNFESMIVDSVYNEQIDRFYVGSDFSGFFYKNKTGEFGLKNCDMAGAFDKTVTEEFLRSKLFVKEEF